MKQLLLLAACAALIGAAPTPAPMPATSPTPKSTPAAKATPAPAKDTDDSRVGISGVWEIALQTPDGVVYTHFKIAQNGAVLTGQYLDATGKKFPLAGTIDGKKVRVVVTMADGSALVFAGTQDSGTDMVGTLTTTKDLLGFTAAYRPKYKWLDNLSPGGSGIGSGVP